MYSMWVKIAFVCLVAAGGTTAALSKTGNFTVFSDTACQDPLFVNSEIKGRDFCAPTDNEGNWGGEATDFIFKSYILNERPWCDNGSRPYFNVYSDQDCANLIKSYPAGALYNPTGPDADGTCVVPGAEYKAVAFVCDGFDTPPPSSTSELPMTSTPTSTSVRVSTTALTHDFNWYRNRIFIVSFGKWDERNEFGADCCRYCWRCMDSPWSSDRHGWTPGGDLSVIKPDIPNIVEIGTNTPASRQTAHNLVITFVLRQGSDWIVVSDMDGASPVDLQQVDGAMVKVKILDATYPSSD
ncbi:hypothetical protein SCAR479_11369 [Seiridium cardinale]|uniref:Uncharacterized protein n=1 Tax=Seiridium cardinale TaxID=138064 RepID=A0ABR2XDK7_9PEZI